MAYFETSKIKDSSGTIINPAQEDSLTLLRAIFKLLKPLGMLTGGQSNRLSVDVNSAVISSGTVSTVSTVSTVTNIPTIANVTAFDLMKAMSRTGYNSGIRSNIT